MKINCNHEILKIEISFLHERSFKNSFDFKLANNFNILDMGIELATI